MRGGKRENAGRKVGSIAKVKMEIREAARVYTDEALQALVDIVNDPNAPAAARVSAATAILDRGYGKPTQALNVDHTANVTCLAVEWVTPHEST